MQPQPSKLFLGSIQHGYDRAARFNDRAICGDLWTEVFRECTLLPGGLRKMFEWDPRRPSDLRNRMVATIRQCIQEGLVPRLALATDQWGREVVVRAALTQTVEAEA